MEITKKQLKVIYETMNGLEEPKQNPMMPTAATHKPKIKGVDAGKIKYALARNKTKLLPAVEELIQDIEELRLKYVAFNEDGTQKLSPDRQACYIDKQAKTDFSKEFEDLMSEKIEVKLHKIPVSRIIEAIEDITISELDNLSPMIEADMDLSMFREE